MEDMLMRDTIEEWNALTRMRMRMRSREGRCCCLHYRRLLNVDIHSTTGALPKHLPPARLGDSVGSFRQGQHRGA